MYSMISLSSDHNKPIASRRSCSDSVGQGKKSGKNLGVPSGKSSLAVYIPSMMPSQYEVDASFSRRGILKGLSPSTLSAPYQGDAVSRYGFFWKRAPPLRGMRLMRRAGKGTWLLCGFYSTGGPPPRKRRLYGPPGEGMRLPYGFFSTGARPLPNLRSGGRAR